MTSCAEEAPRPFFSVVVTTYNREQLIDRCLDSCLDQSFANFEVVVVDDGSTDGTRTRLARRRDQRLRVVTHDRNRGINPARRTAVANARGEWIVICDSDDELLPRTLERLHELVQELPPGVHILRTCLLWDDGRITPAVIPTGVVDYVGYIKWLEQIAEGGDYETDAAHCMHASVFAHTPYFSDRRGAMETLWGLNLAKRERSYFVSDVLHRGHTDAPNSHLRGVGRAQLIPRLELEAPDMLWMAETALAEHGPALERYGPRQWRVLARIAAVQSYLLADRRRGVRYTRACLRRNPRDWMAWATVALGLLGPRAVGYGTLAHRILFARGQARPPGVSWTRRWG